MTPSYFTVASNQHRSMNFVESYGAVGIDSEQLRVAQWDNILELCKTACLEMLHKGVELDRFVNNRQEQLLHRQMAQKATSSLTTALNATKAFVDARQESRLKDQPREAFKYTYKPKEYDLTLARQEREDAEILRMKEDLETSASLCVHLETTIEMTNKTIKDCERDRSECTIWFYNCLMGAVPHVDMNRHSIVQIFTAIIMTVKTINENENTLMADSHKLSSMDPGPAYSPDDVGSTHLAMALKTSLEMCFVKTRESLELATQISHMNYAVTGDWNSGTWRQAADPADTQIQLVHSHIALRADEIRRLETDHVLMWQDGIGYARQSETVAAITELMKEHHEHIQLAMMQLSMEISPSITAEEDATSCSSILSLQTTTERSTMIFSSIAKRANFAQTSTSHSTALFPQSL